MGTGAPTILAARATDALAFDRRSVPDFERTPMADARNGSHPPAASPNGALNAPDSRAGVLALLSGGLDSAIMVGLAIDRGDTVFPLYVRQGFLWEDEEERAVRRFLAALDRPARGRIEPLLLTTLSAPARFAGDWALDASRPAPAADSADEAVFLPGRNLALLTQAALAAWAHGLSRIQLGSLSTNPFPDATAEFFRAFERSAFEAMRRPLRVELPLGRLTKTEALELGSRFPLELTLSCIRPLDGMHCGACNKCAERQLAFGRARLADPTAYIQPVKG
jgi:7-cyano-7-deazaguanine synthase